MDLWHPMSAFYHIILQPGLIMIGFVLLVLTPLGEDANNTARRDNSFLRSGEYHKTSPMIEQHWFRSWLSSIKHLSRWCQQHTTSHLAPTTHIEAETKWPSISWRHFKCICVNENVWISFNISLKFVPWGPINDFPALVEIMTWRQTGGKPLSETMMVTI